MAENNETPETVRLHIDVMVSIRSSDGVLDESVFLTDLVEEYAKLTKFAKGIVELDNPDSESAGFKRRQIITLTEIIKEAKSVLNHLD